MPTAIRTPSAHRYLANDLGDALILPGGYEVPDPTLPPSIPGIPGGEQPQQPAPQLPSGPLPMPTQEEKTEPPWLAIAIAAGAALIAVALWNR